MNDFTKEELMYIADAMLYSISAMESRAKIIITIRERILKMIENYKCDHASDGMCYTSNPPQNKCKKCGEFYR